MITELLSVGDEQDSDEVPFLLEDVIMLLLY